MKQFLEDVKNSIPIITIIFYVIGYAYVKSYYLVFGINFEHYISITDILFFAINALSRLGVLFIGTEFILYFFTYIILSIISSSWYESQIKIRNLKRSKEYPIGTKKAKRLSEVFIKRYCYVITLFTFLIFGLVVWFTSSIEGKEAYFLTIFIVFSLLKLHIAVLKKGEDNSDSNFFLVFILFILAVGMVFIGNSDGENILKDKAERIVNFRYKEETYDTSSGKYVFVGETSSYFFIYEVDKRKTLTISKNNISNLSFEFAEKNGNIIHLMKWISQPLFL